jgi:hypothetical protein
MDREVRLVPIICTEYGFSIKAENDLTNIIVLVHLWCSQLWKIIIMQFLYNINNNKIIKRFQLKHIRKDTYIPFLPNISLFENIVISFYNCLVLGKQNNE